MKKEYLNYQKVTKNMRVVLRSVVPVILFLLFGAVPLKAASTEIMINEILADPPSGGSYDANFDGTWNSSQDEFIELVNVSGYAVDMTSWTLSDGLSVRHTFPNDTILEPGGAIVIFGGGSPPTSPTMNMPQWQYIAVQTASSGQLSLNNSGDTVTLKDEMSMIIDSYNYGSEGGNNQSLTRYPDLGLQWELHSNVSSTFPWGDAFSPGFMINGKEFAGAPVPIPGALWLFGSGIVGLVGLRRKLTK